MAPATHPAASRFAMAPAVWQALRMKTSSFFPAIRKLFIFLGAVPLLLAADNEEGFKPLFPADGVPAGWLVRDWADVSKPAAGAPAWTVKDGTLTSSGDRGCWFLSEK